MTTWTVTSNIPVTPSWINAGNYAILELLTYQFVDGSVDDEVCQIDFDYYVNSNTDDVIMLKSK